MSGLHDENLAKVLSKTLGESAPRIVELAQLSGGASRATWSCTIERADGSSTGLIVQRDRPDVTGAGAKPEQQAAVMRAAAANGVPVAPVVAASDDPGDLGAPYLIVERLSGEAIARRILRDDAYALARQVLVRQLAQALAGIHAIDAAPDWGLVGREPLAGVRMVLDAFPDRPHPAFELGLRWLSQNQPPSQGPVVVHGDFRNGNFLVDKHGLRAVLDWEGVHVGDPMEDLGWLCVRAWRFGASCPVGGFGQYDELFAVYEEATGVRVDPEVVRWWEVLGTLRWGTICMTMSDAHLSGRLRSVELAAIGRRVCENEYDLLALLP